MPSRIRSTVRRGGRDGQSRSDAETTPGRTQPRTERTRPPGRGDRGLRETRWSQSPSTGARKIGGQPEGFRRDPEKDVESSESALGEAATARGRQRLIGFVIGDDQVRRKGKRPAARIADWPEEIDRRNQITREFCASVIGRGTSWRRTGSREN